MLRPTTLEDSPNVTSLQESADGVTPSDSQDGQTTDLSGQEAHPANHSVSQENEKPNQMPDTSGRCSLISSASASLQSSLENKLRQRLGQVGSMIYKMTWKQKTTPRGRSYCQLAASAHRTSDNASGSLPNGWPTPTVRDHKDTGDLSKSMTRKDGKSRLDCVARVASLAGWPTPQTMDTLPPMDYEKRLNHPSRPGRKTSGNLREVVTIAGWPSPTTTDAARGNGTIRPQDTGIPLPQRVTQIDTNQPMRLTASGELLIGSGAEMESGGQLPNTIGWQLNPMFSGCFLMGYPLFWNLAGMKVMKKPKRK